MKGSKYACVCYISVNDCTGLVIHHAVFVVCHSLILSPECYFGSLVFLRGVFQGTSSTVFAALGYSGNVAVSVYAHLCLFSCCVSIENVCQSDSWMSGRLMVVP